ncbi:hypothetical protein [Marinomonas primoryensis]|uniref:CHAT domain-containing protein n=1 Tax=Marinomonas primoryensis TaxID=178399 RepID=A0A859CUE8_9GAMM|nr:hypothetical protein [Marinomonas primoryensis]QKK79988.1 uncharacterized protein MP3633_1254 [Marinomonas primoryensis]
MSGNIFNKLWVIESLPSGELRTGKSLFDNQLDKAKQVQQDLLVEFAEPITKSELFDVLEKIRNEALSGIYPMIHFECHGCKEGLGTSSGELVEWDEIREILIEINRATKLNLMIVIAACNGAHLINVSTRLDAAPFWAIIGPEVEVTAGHIQDNFSRFYESFFSDLDGDKAIGMLNEEAEHQDRTYHFLSAAGLFSRAYRAYYKSHCVGKGKKERIERLVSEAMKNPNVKKRGVAWARQQVKKGLASEDQHFDKLRKRFFFIADFPENDARFPLSKDDIVAT